MSPESRQQQIVAVAKYLGSLIRKTNGKAFIIIDKRYFQYYMYDKNRRLLRIGPVTVGKGNTRFGKFETPVGIIPIKKKEEIADWIQPDWYFREKGLPIPTNYEDRRVRSFFRYKLVLEGTRYIHYRDQMGNRLTHGCLGLDFDDARAVFFTLEVGSYCITVDDAFIRRLARGEFPIKGAVTKKKRKKSPRRGTRAKVDKKEVFQSMW
ncbi:L,D-transpeptidase [Thermodesulfobacteriota bacterium]